MEALPKPYTDVMITYNKTIYYGAYGDRKRKETTTKRGFYSSISKHFAVPPSYRSFNGAYLPHGFGGDRLQLSEVINWEYID